MGHKFPYVWYLKDTVFTRDKGKVFSCFSCGGGSTMGYKLAGFDVIGCNDIDKGMMKLYLHNHHPKYHFRQSITEFKHSNDLPRELFHLDILDGSPPCSAFSLSGNREKDWGVEKVFREGQISQVLDTLFFDFIDVAERLQPKIVVAENVKGLLLGEARDYVRRIYMAFDRAGYVCQHWLLDASLMGVPSRRERVFFIAMRKDLALPISDQIDLFTRAPRLRLDFNERPIPYGEFMSEPGSQKGVTERIKKMMDQRIKDDRSIGDIYKRVSGELNSFNYAIIHPEDVCPTIVSGAAFYRFSDGLGLPTEDYCKIQTFPLDYDFLKSSPRYVIGMSVPPVMIAHIATAIYQQWLRRLASVKKPTYIQTALAL
jgi:DNA (cytosine-5)-methyltransferase 1